MKKIFIQLICIFFFASNTFAAISDDLAKPQKEQLVVDNANIFSPQQVDALKNKLNSFNRKSSTQILVYTTPDLQGYDIADFGQRLGEAWGVGSGKFDNGIVIVFKPKNQSSRGMVTIQTGYGIEPLIPDATANQIVTNEMIPAFKQGDIYGGINNAIDVCIKLTNGEFTAQDYGKQNNESAGGGIFLLIIFAITFFGIFGKSRRSRYSSMGSRSNLPLWTALFLMGSGSSRGSGFSDFSSGSGSFGGGGFGGFGGGSFGGGGASGSW